MDQLHGFESKDHPDYMCKLMKALYGLKYTPRSWDRKIVEFLISSGCMLVALDLSLFIKHKEGNMVIVLVYIDGLILNRDHVEEIQQTKDDLPIGF